jgi:hypothetical protein
MHVWTVDIEWHKELVNQTELELNLDLPVLPNQIKHTSCQKLHGEDKS